MQKIVNIIAVASGVVAIAVVGSGLFVYVNRDSIIDSVKQQALEAVTGGFGGLGGAALPTGTNDLPSFGDDAALGSPSPAPQEAASSGFGIPN